MKHDIAILSSVRGIAYQILDRVSRQEGHADDLVHTALNRNELQGADRGLLMELVLGTLRFQGALDFQLTSLCRQSFQDLEPSVQILLRLGAYQIIHLSKIPPHAAVYETVAVTHGIIPRAAGLVNAILRKLASHPSPAVLPDPATAPVLWLSSTHSLPLWLAEYLIQQLGLDDAARLASVYNTPPPLTIRMTRSAPKDTFLAMLEHVGAVVTPCHYAKNGYLVAYRGPITELPGYSEGWFTVQDEGAQLVSIILDPKPGESILDMCAAPGGKTVHIAELANDQATITATDLKEKRLRKLEQTIARLQLRSIICQAGDALSPSYLPQQQFDRILLDAPCSGLGVFRRNPEGKWHIRPEDIQRLQIRQRALLDSAAFHLKVGGVLVYATCSTTIEENEQVVDDFLSQHPEFMIDTVSNSFPELSQLVTSRGYLRCWSHRDGTDGFFVARLRKKKEGSE